MTDLEFDILDELYFLTDFEEMIENLQIEEKVLKNELRNLIGKGWAKMLEKETDTEIEAIEDFDKNCKKYNYLATKAGLLAHNSK